MWIWTVKYFLENYGNISKDCPVRSQQVESFIFVNVGTEIHLDSKRIKNVFMEVTSRP